MRDDGIANDTQFGLVSVSKPTERLMDIVELLERVIISELFDGSPEVAAEKAHELIYGFDDGEGEQASSEFPFPTCRPSRDFIEDAKFFEQYAQVCVPDDCEDRNVEDAGVVVCACSNRLAMLLFGCH